MFYYFRSCTHSSFSSIIIFFSIQLFSLVVISTLLFISRRLSSSFCTLASKWWDHMRWLKTNPTYQTMRIVTVLNRSAQNTFYSSSAILSTVPIEILVCNGSPTKNILVGLSKSVEESRKQSFSSVSTAVFLKVSRSELTLFTYKPFSTLFRIPTVMSNYFPPKLMTYWISGMLQLVWFVIIVERTS